ncbi:hypothetical protein [Flavobacterium sp. ov086]|uniref:hypothetical protein n=1 Tax=Flavobacterium sp. ov086 TaxID=1761785 RepID=UPI000B6F7F23|nr:hypothetical protein [Flavobacterium sp. ov086]SNR95843.1 hypothetical protein SAMN04487979_13447 [Flavobacterium sp. ov086]
MEALKLNEIINICNEATKAPWKSFIEGRDHESGSSFIMTGEESDRDYDIEFINIKNNDQDFIAMARNKMPDLVTEILRLQKILNDNSITF